MTATDHEWAAEAAVRQYGETAAGLLARYHDLLATTAVERGLIGPREPGRLWTRHVFNCAVVADPVAGLVPVGASVIDVGSGAGLPGLVWGLVRPDLKVTLVEPLLRRAAFLAEAVDELGVGSRVVIRRARAEEVRGELAAGIVTARAVADLRKLLPWLAPLVAPGGSIVVLRGQSARAEVAECQSVPARLGLGPLRVREVTGGLGSAPGFVPATVVITSRERRAR